MNVAVDLTSDFEADKVESLLGLGLNVQAVVYTRDFLNDNIAEFLSKFGDKIKSLYYDGNGDSVFEDTVFVASKIEDYFDINLDYIVTSAKPGNKHVIELVEFYNHYKEIVVRTPVLGSGDCSPIGILMHINWLHFKGHCSSMSFDIMGINEVWKSRYVYKELSPFISELYINTQEPLPFGNFQEYSNITFNLCPRLAEIVKQL